MNDPVASHHCSLTIGVTGHRPNRMVVGEAEIARRLRLVLAALKQGVRRGRPQAITSIAEGSDRLFADAALALGYRLAVLLPFASADYETTFSDKSATGHYRALLAAAAEVNALAGTLEDSKAAYEVVGRAMVDQSDIIIAVWDGKPAAGRGGTPEIIEYAVAQGKPVIWINAARLRLPRLIAAPTGYGAGPLSLDKSSARARALTRTRIVQLAARS